MEKLTEEKYWKEYYLDATENPEIISKICSKFDFLFDQIHYYRKSQKVNTIFEVGCFPGRYLAYLAKKFNAFPAGIDQINEKTKIKRIMTNMGILTYKYIIDDFLQFKPGKKYDLVFSNGFVEHFNDYDNILDMHLEYVNSDGIIFLLIPNKRYLRYVYGYIFDRKNLFLHNIKCMRKEVIESFAMRNNLKIMYLEYYGGFPYAIHDKINGISFIVYRLLRKIFQKINPILAKYPHKIWSGTIIAILYKPN